MNADGGRDDGRGGRDDGHDGRDAKREAMASFDEAADAYLDSDVHRSGGDLDALAAWSADASRALDVACGAGHTANALVEAGVPEVVAADATPRMVRTATANFPVAGAVADAERLPFASGSFDAVTCRVAAHHFPDPEAFVREVSRVLAPGRTFAFEDVAAPEDPDLAAFVNRFEELRDGSHVAAHPLSRWESWMRDAGLAVERATTGRLDLDFADWVDRTDPPAADRERLAQLVRTPEAAEAYEVTIEDGEVAEFSNVKALVRARKPA